MRGYFRRVIYFSVIYFKEQTLFLVFKINPNLKVEEIKLIVELTNSYFIYLFILTLFNTVKIISRICLGWLYRFSIFVDKLFLSLQIPSRK